MQQLHTLKDIEQAIATHPLVSLYIKPQSAVFVRSWLPSLTQLWRWKEMCMPYKPILLKYPKWLDVSTC